MNCIKDNLSIFDSNFENEFGKYVFIYSKRYYTHRPQYGVYEDCNGFLSFKYLKEN